MELGHRIKAVSSSSFTLSEIELLKSKTNAHAHALWMGGYNPKVHRPLPDGSSQSALRQFIQEKYILKRFQAVTVFGFHVGSAQATIISSRLICRFY
jgi:hypothetical protein